MNKEKKLLFLNKQLGYTNSELEDFNQLFEFLDYLGDQQIPVFYLGLIEVKDQLIESAIFKKNWLEQKIQEIEAE
jgi:hypothetical protein